MKEIKNKDFFDSLKKLSLWNITDFTDKISLSNLLMVKKKKVKMILLNKFRTDIFLGGYVENKYALCHKDIISNLSISPCKRFIASSSWDKTAKIWEFNFSRNRVSILKLKYVFMEHSGIISCVAWNCISTLFCTSSYDKSIIIWSIETGQSVNRLNCSEKIFCLTFHPIISDLLVTGGNIIILWQNGLILSTIKEHIKKVNTIMFNNGGTKLFSSAYDCLIIVYDTSNIKNIKVLHRFVGHKDFIKSVCLSPSENFIASGGFESIIYIWNIDTGKKLMKLEGHKSYINCIEFTLDAKFLLSASDNIIIIWDFLKSAKLWVFNRHMGEIRLIKQYPNKPNFFISTGDDGMIIIWSISEGKEKRVLNSTIQEKIWGLEIFPGREIIFSSCDMGNLLVWN